MKEKTIQMEDLFLHFTINKDNRQLQLPKSQTHVKDIRQLGLITEPDEYFVPIAVEEEADTFTFTFPIDQDAKKWEDLKSLRRNDKLRLLCNIARLKTYLHTRTTFFLHPDNLVFDDNLLPAVIYRGIRNLLPPYEMDNQTFLKQYQCLVIALFSKTYTFDQLYQGSLQNADETEFQRQVREMEDLEQLIQFLEDSYKEEQKKTEAAMQLVPAKRFRLFKGLSIGMITLSVLLIIPLSYLVFWKLPYQETLQASHQDYLASDYGGVISTLEDEDAEELPFVNKYILAVSYINVEDLSDADRESIMRNVSLNSDKNYLMYWIYNGRGNIEESVDIAKYLSDPVLIMHGLIRQIEQVSNDPELTGTEQQEKVDELEQELAEYRDEYNVPAEEEESDNQTDALESNEDEGSSDNE